MVGPANSSRSYTGTQQTESYFGSVFTRSAHATADPGSSPDSRNLTADRRSEVLESGNRLDSPLHVRCSDSPAAKGLPRLSSIGDWYLKIWHEVTYYIVEKPSGVSRPYIRHGHSRPTQSAPQTLLQHARRAFFESVIPCGSTFCTLSLRQPVFQV
jgi:hypothetical protein